MTMSAKYTLCQNISCYKYKPALDQFYSVVSSVKYTKNPGGVLKFKGGYDACSWTYKMDPKQVFFPTKKHKQQVFWSVFAALSK